MAVTRDNNFLITSSDDYRLRKISIPSQKVVKGFDVITPGMKPTMQVAPGDESLFVHDQYFYLRLIHLTDGITIHDFGKTPQEDNIFGY
jgi:hypothetical protein